MANILIIDNQPERRGCLFLDLEQDGHRVSAVGSRELEYISLDCLTFDIAIINLFPDASATWDLHHEFKCRLPDFPVLVYMIKNTHTIESLKSAMKEILNKKQSCSLNKFSCSSPVIDSAIEKKAFSSRQLSYVSL